MKRLNRNEEAVSPVIATILMVAITVVLAATLYMMVGDIGGDDVQQLTGDITHNGDGEMEVVSISPNPAAEDVTVTVLGIDNGDEEAESIDDWQFLDDGEVQSGSRFNITEHSDFSDSWSDQETELEQVDEVVIQVDGVDGTISYEM